VSIAVKPERVALALPQRVAIGGASVALYWRVSGLHQLILCVVRDLNIWGVRDVAATKWRLECMTMHFPCMAGP
jgi:hypothetical protein